MLIIFTVVYKGQATLNVKKLHLAKLLISFVKLVTYMFLEVVRIMNLSIILNLTLDMKNYLRSSFERAIIERK